MIREFREFISRGNVIDLAVAVIIGVAFGAIVTSLVNAIIMPIIGVLVGGVNFSSLFLAVGEAKLAYGSFIQAVINFLMIAFVVFLIVRMVNNVQARFRRSEEVAPILPLEPPANVKLLTEIRDLLRAGY